MCGIAGFLGRYSEDVARDMRTRIVHRGPDSSGLFFDAEEGIALAHQRLSIIDLSELGSQPMTDASGRFLICYNGEVYNYRELRHELETSGHRFRGGSDTEVILELFARHGTASFERLNGIFALAVWDRRDQTLSLARDGAGVKPLYLVRSSKGIVFASEMKALLALPDLDRTIDPVAASAYLTFLWSPGERTMFASVKKLPPGSWLTVRRSGKDSAGTFSPWPQPRPDERYSDAELIRITAEKLEQAVARQMVSDVEPGAFLSGGLDSSAVVALARNSVGAHAPLQCFTIDYREAERERGEMLLDLPYAERVAKHLGVKLHRVMADSGMAYEFEQLMYTLDEPQADPAAANSLLISAAARSAGIKVMLSGVGGDDLFTGYRRHQAARYDHVFDRVPLRVRQAIASCARNLLPSTGIPRRLRKALGAVDRDAESRAIGYFEWLDATAACGLIVQELRPAPYLTRQSMRSTLGTLESHDAVARVLWLDQHHFLADHNLNYTDKTGMAEGVEIRVPFLDRDLVKWAATVPMHAKLRGAQTKWVLKKAMEPLLPHDVIYRPKTGFGVPLRSWLKHELRDLLENLLSPDSIRGRGLFDVEAVQRLRRDTAAGRTDGSYSLLALVAIELWCRQFVDTPLGSRPGQRAE
jgi:asparagine synthase (glutamine-hydrolysing)